VDTNSHEMDFLQGKLSGRRGASSLPLRQRCESRAADAEGKELDWPSP
jgi:hypothetical protein